MARVGDAMEVNKAVNAAGQRESSITTITNADRVQLKPALLNIFGLKGVAEDAYASIDMWLKQKTLVQQGKIDDSKLLYDLEYFSLKDQKGKIFGVAGIYTVQTSAPGFGAKDNSWIVARSGWTGVTEEARGKGYGKLIVELEIQKARERGAKIFCWETSPVWENVPPLLRGFGFVNNSNVKDYYGKGIDLRSLYTNLEAIDLSTSAKLIETYDNSKLNWLKPILGEKKFAWLSEVVEKAAYTKKIAETFPGIISATPYMIEDNGRPIGFSLLSMYQWEGAPERAPKATFVAAERGKEDVVAQAIAQKAKELGMRMLVVEVPKGENVALEKSIEKIGFVTSRTIKGLYGVYDIDGKEQAVDQLIFSRELKTI
jgi:GNAT superfamily N-acetyltransferase